MLNTQQVEYLGHRPNCEEFERDYTTVAVLRDPYDIFLSGYRHHKTMYVDNHPGYLIQDHIDNITTNGYKGYKNTWFEFKQPQHLIMFEKLQHEWFEFLHMHGISHNNQLPHLHNTTCDKSLESTPTASESEQIRNLLSEDIDYYHQLKKQIL